MIGLGKRFAVHAPPDVRFRDCVVPKLGKFSTGKTVIAILAVIIVSATYLWL